MKYQELQAAIDDAKNADQQATIDFDQSEQLFYKQRKQRRLELLELQSQLLDALCINIFRLYPNLQSFVWRQSGLNSEITIEQIQIEDTVFWLWANGGDGYLGDPQTTKLLSKEALVIAKVLDQKIREVPPSALAARFGTGVRVTATRQGFQVQR